MASAWSGRVLAMIKEKAPIAMTYQDGIAWGNAWVVPRGAPNAKLAMEAINYAISPEAQERLLDFAIYGPVLVEAAAKGTPEQRKFMVTAPENIKDALILNEQQAALYSAKYENDWSRMQLE
jgi:putative spermidine/putrescine transport system substrate-binding protein